jgi:hypothetical protein
LRRVFAGPLVLSSLFLKLDLPPPPAPGSLLIEGVDGEFLKPTICVCSLSVVTFKFRGNALYKEFQRVRVRRVMRNAAFVLSLAIVPVLQAQSTSGDINLNRLAEAVNAIHHDNLWQMPFPYVMPLHQAPTDGGDYSSFHFHFEFHPPLRRPNLLKYLAGPEIGGGNFLSDTAPEEKAAELRAQPDQHYKHVLQEQL